MLFGSKFIDLFYNSSRLEENAYSLLDTERVRYRQQRKVVEREVIQQKAVRGEMTGLIFKEALESVPQEDRQDFIDDVIEELEQMDEIRIARLGVTSEELNDWLIHYRLDR